MCSESNFVQLLLTKHKSLTEFTGGSGHGHHSTETKVLHIGRYSMRGTWIGQGEIPILLNAIKNSCAPKLRKAFENPRNKNIC